RELRLLGRRVAVDALEVAGLGRVPHHHRPAAAARAVLLFRGALVIAEPVAEKTRPAEKFGYADHLLFASVERQGSAANRSGGATLITEGCDDCHPAVDAF